MPDAITRTRKPVLPLAATVAAMTTVVAVAAVSFASSARAAGPPDVLLGTAADFSVLGHDGITKTGPIAVTGLVGSTPTGISGTGVISPSGVERDIADVDVAIAKADLLIAYGQAAGAQTPTTALAADIGNRTLTGGTYNRAGSLGFTGTLTLDGENDPNSVFIIQVGQDFTTATGASVVLTRGAQACHVYWQIGNDAVIEVDTAFKGNILAGNDISAKTRATFEGRLLTNTGAVTLDTNTITNPVCATATTPAPTVTTPAPTTTTPTATPTRATPRPTATTPARGRGGAGDSDDSDDSDSDGGGSGSGGPTGTDGGGTTSGGGSDGDGSSTTSTPGLPDAGGPPWYLAPLGGVVVLAGLGVAIAARAPRGMHRS
ncbi:MAG: ice-binding family protein [Aeromicrobium sp.]